MPASSARPMPLGILKANPSGRAGSSMFNSNSMPSRSTDAWKGPNSTPNEADSSTFNFRKLPPSGCNAKLSPCSENGPVGRLGTGRLAFRPVPFFRRSWPALSASASMSRSRRMPSPRISLRNTSVGFSRACTLRAKKPNRGAPLASRRPMPSSPITSVAPSASLPSSSAPPGAVRETSSARSNAPLTPTGSSGNTGSRTLAATPDVKLILTLPPPSALLRSRLSASAAWMALGAPSSNSSARPRPGSAGITQLGRPASGGRTWGGPQPVAGAAMGVENERSITLPMTSVRIASAVCASSICCGVVAPASAASWSASWPAAAATPGWASPLSVNSILAMLNALG